MKINKVIRWLCGFISFMPLIIIGVGLLTSLFTYRINTGSFGAFPLNDTLSNTFDSLSLFDFPQTQGESVLNDYLGTGAFTLSSNVGVFNFVGLFNGVFINLDIQSDYANIYLFINWYLNYVLFVQLVFFAPRVLMWFINFGFSMVDRFTNKSQKW